MTRRHSPAPTARYRRWPQDDDKLGGDTRDITLPTSQPPIAAVRAQVVGTQHGFAAMSEGSVASLCGGSIAETCADQFQVFRCGPRCRPLQCCALSPCGRYLAAGEAGGPGFGKAPHVLVFNISRTHDAPTCLRGHHYGVRLLGWSPRSLYIVSIGDAEHEQSELQIMLWSWPQGERLATALCWRGTSDLRFSPEVNVFAVMSNSAVKRWNISQPQEPYLSARSRRGPPQLFPHPVPAHALGMNRSHGDRVAGRLSGRRSNEDSLVAIACGFSGVLFVLTRRGRLTSVIGAEAERSIDVGKQGHSLVWTSQLCGLQRPQGLLVCGLSGGLVQIYDAAMLQPLVSLDALGVGGCGPDAVGISVSHDMDALWVLHGDKSLSRWRDVQDRAEPDRNVKAPVPGMRDARTVPGVGTPQVVTCTEDSLQLWSEVANRGLKLERRVQQPGTSRTGELTTLSCSSWAVACGHKGGHIHLMSLPSLGRINCEFAKQGGDIIALSFGSHSAGSLLLASASRDRSAAIFRIDPTGWNSMGQVQSAEVTTLLTLANHSAATQCIALVGSPASTIAQLAVCTADKLLILRELEVSPTSAVVRRQHKHIGRSKSWIGLCFHPDRNILFAACGDRRLLQLEPTGRCQHALRIGGPDAELCAPLRLCPDGRILAVGVTMSGLSSNAIINSKNVWNPGVFLFDVSNGAPKPLALLSGHADTAAGLAFLGRGNSMHILTCWGDGAMLVWDAPQQQGAPSPTIGHRMVASYPQQTASEQPAPVQRMISHPEPSFVKLATEPQESNTGAGHLKWDPVSEWSPIKSPEPTSQKFREIHTAPPKVRCPDGFLERLFSSSPPPKWAETSMNEGNDGIEQAEGNEPSINLGRWGRDSQVGAQVRSAADLYLTGTFDSTSRGLDSQASAQVRCAADLYPMPMETFDSTARGCDSQISTQVRSAADFYPMPMGALDRGRDSQLGAQVRSASTASGASDSTTSVATPASRVASKTPKCSNMWAGGDDGPTGSSSERCLRAVNMHGAQRSFSEGKLAVRSLNYDAERTEAVESRASSHCSSSSSIVLLASTRHQSQSCTSLDAPSVASRQRCASVERLRLPPKPRHSPPICSDAPLRPIQVPAQAASMQSTKESLQQVEAIVRALRQQQSRQVLVEVGKLLVQGCAHDCRATARANSENTPPCEAEPQSSSSSSTDVAAKESVDFEKLRAQLQCLCAQRLLKRETADVSALFRRIEEIFAQHASS